MSLDISIEVRQNYIYVGVTGIYEINEAIDRFNEVLSAITIHKVFKILIDYRNLQELPLLMTENYIYSASIANKIQQHIDLMDEHPRIAYVGPERRIREGYGEKVASEYGFHNVKEFTDINEALRWLEVGD